MKRPQVRRSSRRSPRARRATDPGHWSEAEARQILAGWDPTRQTLGDYARSRGEHPSRLAYWKTKFAAVRGPAPVGFLSVVVTPPASSAPPPASSPARGDFEIVRRAGRRVCVPADFEPAALARLVRALEAVPPC